MGLFVFLFHGAKLFSDNIGIDTEDIIKLQGDFYGGWLTTGRQGLVFLKGLLGSLQFNPYFAGLMTLIFLTLGVFSFFLLWDWLSEGKQSGSGRSFWGFCLGGMLWISHPVMTEQLYFSLQSAEISLGFFFTAAALFCTRQWIKKRRILYFAAGSLLLVLTFSLYQVFVALYIFGTVTLLFLEGLKKECPEDAGKEKNDRLFRQLLCYVAVFFTAFAANTLITGLFFGSSDYLRGQVVWQDAGVLNGFKGIAGHIARVCTGIGSPYYSLGYGILCLLAAVLLCALLRKGEYRGRRLFLLFLFFSLMLTPFLMTIVCGGAPAVRSQLVLPAMTGFLGWLNLYLSGLLKRERKGAPVTGILWGVCLITALFQLQVTCRLYYTDSMRYEQDAALGRNMIARIEQVRGKEQLPVVFIGKREFKGNHACLEGEVIGRSFFDYDTEVEPANYWSTRRILGLLYILGGDYAMIDKERLPEAVRYSTYMPEWPAENSVQIWNGMIVVKLS